MSSIIENTGKSKRREGNHAIQRQEKLTLNFKIFRQKPYKIDGKYSYMT